MTEMPFSAMPVDPSPPEQAEIMVTYWPADAPKPTVPLPEGDAYATFMGDRTISEMAMKQTGWVRGEEGRRAQIALCSDSAEWALMSAQVSYALPLLIWQRGFMLMHACCVALPSGEAIAVVGEPGAGKSTLLAALIVEGCRLIVDDILPIRFREDGAAMAQPGYPMLKLMPASAKAVGWNPDEIAPVCAGHPKVAKVLPPEQFQESEIPLKAIYVLEPIEQTGQASSMEPLKGVGKAMELRRHSYTRLFAPEYCASKQGTKEMFQDEAKLGQAIEMVCLKRSNDLSQVADLARMAMGS